jgi:hypothetical protein
MVRALLDGSKTQTRRIVKHKFSHLNREPYYVTGKVLTDLPTQPGAWMEYRYREQDEPGFTGSPASALVPCPYGQPGDHLYVRETFRPVDDRENGGEFWYDYRATPRYAEWHPAGWENDSDDPYALKWRPSIDMPRAASRITLEIVSVRRATKGHRTR